MPRPARARRHLRIAATLSPLVLVLGMLAAAGSASAAVTSPAPGATVSGAVPITESRGATNNCLARDNSSSRLEVLDASGTVVHSASRNGSGSLSTTWSSVGRDNGTYRIRSFARDSQRSGFANLGCTTRSETQLSNHTVVLDNRAAVDVGLPASVVTGEDLTIEVTTTLEGTGVSGRPAAGREVVVSVPELGDRTVVTGSDGRGSLTVELPILPVGDLEVRAEVTSDATLRGLSGRGTTRLEPRTTALEYTGATRAQPGATAALSAQLVDATPGSDRAGQPIAGRDVELDFGGSARVETTDAEGIAERTVVVRGGSRTVDVGASFAGDTRFTGADDEVVFYVGDAAAQEAQREHDALGGVVRGLNSLLAGILGPVTSGLDQLAAQSPIASLILDPLDALGAALGLPPRTGSVWDVEELDAILDLTLATVTNGLVALADDSDVVIDDLLENIELGPDLDALVDVSRFRWRSVVEVDGESEAREFRATIGLPQPLDVTGDGHPDVLANLTLASELVSLETGGVRGLLGLEVDTSGDPRTLVPRLEVARLASAPDDLPLSLQALVDVPGGDDQLRLGYDTRDSQAPEGFVADLVPGDGEVAVELATRSEHPLSVSGALVPGGEGTSSTPAPREQRFAISFDTAPTAARVGVSLDGGQQDVAAQLESETATAVDLSFADDSGDQRITLADVGLRTVEGTAGVVVTGDGSDGVSAEIASASGLDEVVVDGRQLEAGRTATEVRLALEDVPDAVSFALAADGTGSLETSAPIGVFEAGYATDRSIATLDDEAYLRLLENGSSSSVSVRLPEFEQMSLGLGDDLSVRLTKKAGPLRVLADLPDLTVSGTVADAPRDLALGVASDGGISVEGSQEIAALDLSARSSSPDGIFQGAQQVDVRLRDLPERLEVSADGDGVVFETVGRPVGLVELDAHSGTPLSLPEQTNGLVLDRNGGSTALTARVEGLRRIEAAVDETPELFLDTVARAVFSVTVVGETPQETVRATLDRLVPQTRITLADDANGATSLSYEASEPTNSLELGLGGLQGSISGPLPAALDICMAEDDGCLPEAGVADPTLGSIRFETSEYTTLNLADPSRGLTVEDLRLRRLDLTGSIGDDGGPLYLNTTSFDGECGFAGCEHPLRGGRVVSNLGDAELTFTPGDGFSAVDAVTELETTEILGVPTGLRGRSGTGIVRCVPQTALRVRVEIIGIPITVNLRDAICNVSRPPRTP